MAPDEMIKAGLTEDEQFVLCALDGLCGERRTHAEIAEKLGIPETRVMVLARHGRLKMMYPKQEESGE